MIIELENGKIEIEKSEKGKYNLIVFGYNDQSDFKVTYADLEDLTSYLKHWMFDKVINGNDLIISFKTDFENYNDNGDIVKDENLGNGIQLSFKSSRNWTNIVVIFSEIILLVDKIEECISDDLED